MKSLLFITLASLAILCAGSAQASTTTAGRTNNSNLSAEPAGPLKLAVFEPISVSRRQVALGRTPKTFLAAEPGDGDASSSWFLLVASVVAIGFLMRRRMARD